MLCRRTVTLAKSLQPQDRLDRLIELRQIGRTAWAQLDLRQHYVAMAPGNEPPPAPVAISVVGISHGKLNVEVNMRNKARMGAKALRT